MSSLGSDFAGVLARAAREIAAAESSAETADVAVRFAAEQVTGCTAASVTQLLRRGRLTTLAATDDLVVKADQLQYEYGEGPCVQAIVDQMTVHSRDLARDDRWPRWGPEVALLLGVGSMLSLQLYTSDRTVGALNLYGAMVDGFDPDAIEDAYQLASHVAQLLDAAQAEENYRSSVASRTTIGQAQGILMERFGLTSDQAFALLRRVSQDHNVRLVEVATELVETRRTPT